MGAEDRVSGGGWKKEEGGGSAQIRLREWEKKDGEEIRRTREERIQCAMRAGMSAREGGGRGGEGE